MDNTAIIDARIRHIANSEYDFFLNKANVLGIGLGYKVQNGFYTCQKCIKVFVSTKLPENQLTLNNLVPVIYKGILTDVTEVGYFKFQLLDKKVRPTICGYSIGPNVLNYYKNTGSIGCVVKDAHSEYLLSSAHVLTALNNLPVGTSIVQPSLYDAGTQGDEVGKIAKYIPLKPEGLISKPTNFIDAAIVRLAPKVSTSPDIAFIGRPTGIDTVSLIDIVFKSGRTTEETSGSITAINVTCEISLNNGTNSNKYLFKNQIMTTKMSSDGDSGAVLIKSNKKIVGLLMGTTSSNSVYNNIQQVLQLLNVHVVC